MAKYGIVYTLHTGARERRHIVEAWIVDVPDGLKIPEITAALEQSRYLGEYSERGVFLGNRRILSESALPKDHTVASEAREILWGELSGAQKSSTVQLNVRVSAQERAVFMNAAAAEGVSLTEWVKTTLREKAGG